MAITTSSHVAIPTTPPDSPLSPLSDLASTPPTSPSFLDSITKPFAASTVSTPASAPTLTPAAPANTRRSSRVVKQTARCAALDNVKSGKVQKPAIAAKKRARSPQREASSSPAPIKADRPATSKKRPRSSQDDADADNETSPLEPPKKKYYLKFDLSRTPSPKGKSPISESAKLESPKIESITSADPQNSTDKETPVSLPSTKTDQLSKKPASTDDISNKKVQSSKKPVATLDTSKKNISDFQNNDAALPNASAKNSCTSKKPAATDDASKKDPQNAQNDDKIPAAKASRPKKARKVAVRKAAKALTKKKPEPAPVPEPLTVEQIAERTEMTTFYFAYGKELSLQYMEKKFPGCKAALYGVAKVSDFKFVLHSDGFAKIHPQVGSEVYGVLWEVPEFIRATMEAKVKKHGMEFLEVPSVQMMMKDPDSMLSDFNAKLVPCGESASAWMGVCELDGNEEMGKETLKENPYKHRLLNEAILQLRSDGVPFDYVMENLRPWAPMPATPYESSYWNSRKPAKV